MFGMAVGIASLLAMPGHSLAQTDDLPPVDLSLSIAGDSIGVVSGDGSHRAFHLALADGTADFDLEKLVGWQGAQARLRAQVTTGGEPNNAIGTLRGLDNIEVGRQRTRLYEAWIEQSIGERISVKAGLEDLNSEFYANNASALLIAPPYGIGSELSATGVSGPSIFPSTAPAVRTRFASGDFYVQAALVGADARTLGDPGGIDSHFRAGGLMIAQAGRSSEGGSVGVGVWRYTRRQDDLFTVGALGAPIRRTAQGAYVLVEKAFGDATYFVRGGVSDGRTTPFKAGWQAGVLIAPAVGGRTDSQFSVGLGQELLGSAYRAAELANGSPTGRTETALELTYADRVVGALTLQPDLQIVWRPAGREDRDTLVVLGLRARLDF